MILHATAAGAAASGLAGGGSSTGNANAKDDDKDDNDALLIIVVIVFLVLVFALLAFVVMRKMSGGSSSMTPRGPSSTYQNPEFAPQNGSTAKRPDWADPNVPFLSRPEAEVTCCRNRVRRPPATPSRGCAARCVLQSNSRPLLPKCSILGFF